MMRDATFLVKDLDGCEVLTEKGESLGILRDVLPTGANDVFVVKKGSEEILIPALKEIVREINLADRRIVVKLPKGLREEKS